MAERYVYAPGGVFDSLKSPRQIQEQMVVDGYNTSPADFRYWPKDLWAERGIYELEYVGSPPTQYHKEVAPIDNGIQPDGRWRFTRQFVQEPLTDIKLKARRTIGNWLKNADASKFTAGAKEYVGTTDNEADWNRIAINVLIDNVNVNEVIFAHDGDPTIVDTAAKWTAFWNAYSAHKMSNRDTAKTVWQAVTAATTLEDVDAALATLPSLGDV